MHEIQTEEASEGQHEEGGVGVLFNTNINEFTNVI